MPFPIPSFRYSLSRHNDFESSHRVLLRVLLLAASIWVGEIVLGCRHRLAASSWVGTLRGRACCNDNTPTALLARLLDRRRRRINQIASTGLEFRHVYMLACKTDYGTSTYTTAVKMYVLLVRSLTQFATQGAISTKSRR